MLHGMWDLPGPGIKPVSPELAGRLLTTAPPGKSRDTRFKMQILSICYLSSILPVPFYCFFLDKVPPTLLGICLLFTCIFFHPSAYEYVPIPPDPILRKTYCVLYYILNKLSTFSSFPSLSKFLSL